MSTLKLGVFTQKIKNIFWHLPKSVFYNYLYSFPSKKFTLIGVTGTDGKTTTSTLIYSILQKAGYNTGLITTIGARIGAKEISTGLHTTSPDPSVIQKLFRDMAQAGITHVVCEVTSHALDQHRYWGCDFDISALTNVTHEHLDYHRNMTNYIDSKARLFKQSKLAVLNKDDVSFDQIKGCIKSPVCSYGIKSKSDFQAKNIKLGEFLSFNVNGEKIVTDSNYSYQVYNITCALAVISKLQIDTKYLIDTVKTFPETKGRREVVLNDLNINTIIDFAHTPAALQETLKSLKKVSKGKLLVIFGATGGRDPSKRPLMGQFVSENSDIAFITADDTRNENVNDINRQIIEGINPDTSLFVDNHHLSPDKIKKIISKNQEKFIYFSIPNRQDAFNLAVKLAKNNDTIIACGKGHETTILHGQTEYPWSEQEAYRTAFRLK
ncbi:MAG: Mur ligase family protein [Patescibacteria group bacterium]|jgi:UDP-N-acetylmuramoyl-L-alanyl-D-glutamate--2,6-diaminopimelate ligase